MQPGKAQWWSRATSAVQIGWGDEAVVAADVEDAAVGVEEDPDQVAVTRHPADRGTGQVEAVLGGPDSGLVAVQSRVVNGDDIRGRAP